MDYDALMARLEGLGSAANWTRMARYGINTARVSGILAPELKAVAQNVGRYHALVGRLWASGINEVRMLATHIDEPAKVNVAQMEAWVADFDS
jgi:3-methyladenine DNA glycosylase AlkD